MSLVAYGPSGGHGVIVGHASGTSRAWHNIHMAFTARRCRHPAAGEFSTIDGPFLSLRILAHASTPPRHQPLA